MAEREFDVVALTSPENLTYVSGATVPSQRLVRSRLAAAIVPRTGGSAVVAVSLEGELVREQARLDEVLTYEEFVEDPIDVIAEAIRSCGAATGRIGVETTHLSARDHSSLG